MSNEEKLKIERYRKRREKLIIFQASIIAVLSIVFFILLGAFNSVNQTTNINYYETSKIDYKVTLTNNDLYTEDQLGEDYGFVSSLIKEIEANINYDVEVDSEETTFEYKYKIDANLVITDKTTNKDIYKPVYSLVEEKKGLASDKLSIKENIKIDYNQYNQEVINFVSTLNLSSTTSKLVVSTSVDFIGQCGNSVSSDSKVHTFDLIIPLNETVIDIKESNTSTNKIKVLSCEKIGQRKTLVISLIAIGSLDLIAGLTLLIYTLSTRNSHINYTNKVKRIVKSYKSFIQKINNQFDTSKYQVLLVDTINEMLEIRDTLQSPILMNENEDKTMTKFIIPTNNNLLYVFEIKIENYDEIYGDEELNRIEEYKEEPVLEQVVETPIVQIEEEVVSKEEEKEIIEEKPVKLTYGHNYSFEAKLTLSKDEVKDYYQAISKFAKEYGVKVTRSYKKERIHLGRKHIATMVFKGKTLCVLFPINPADSNYEKYNFIDMSKYSKYEENPAMIKVTSLRKVKYVLEIVEKLFVENEIKDKNLTIKNTVIKAKSKRTLLKEGLIKVNN